MANLAHMESPVILAANLQSMLDLASTGNITVVGALVVAVTAFYFGLVIPKHSVEEIRKRLIEREQETAALHADLLKRVEGNAELRGQLAQLQAEIEDLREELRTFRRSTQGDLS